MALVGYARCSTTPQELEHQLEGLKAALVDQLFSEHISGAAPFSERVELAANGEIQLAAHRWYGLEGAVLEQQLLLDSKGLVST